MNENPSPVACMIDVTKHYEGPHGGTLALKNIHFETFPGELVLLLGPSGSGKTTLLTLLAGLQGPTSGDILLFGKKTTDYTTAELQKLRAYRLGFVFQTFLLLESLSVLENVTLVQKFVNIGRNEARQNALKMLERFGIAHLADKYPAQISQGEKQRVALARALVNGADLIFADEPTGNLASRQGMEIVEYLRDCARNDQKSILITSHDERIIAYADHVYRISDGELIKEK